MDERKIAALLGEFNNAVDRAYVASRGIRVIDPKDKEEDEETIAKARSTIAEASCVYVLGYGFDQRNSQRLKLRESLGWGKSPTMKAVMFTNFGDNNRINKRASKVIHGTYDGFLKPEQSVRGQPTDWYVEKSVKNVYDALELDFESLEQELLGGTVI